VLKNKNTKNSEKTVDRTWFVSYNTAIQKAGSCYLKVLGGKNLYFLRKMAMAPNDRSRRAGSFGVFSMKNGNGAK
jgi:hypothetical protein